MSGCGHRNGEAYAANTADLTSFCHPRTLRQRVDPHQIKNLSLHILTSP